MSTLGPDDASPHPTDGLNTRLEGSQALAFIVASFTGVAWFNSVELTLLIFVTFQRWKGPYFWSLIVSSLAIIPYMLGFLMYFFKLTTNNYLSIFFVTIGWWPMVTGQSLVLWSRLHLVSQNREVLGRIKWMIIIDALLFHVPTTALTFLALGPTGGGSPKVRYGYGVMEKIQMTAFCLQELTIATVYLREVLRLLRSSYHEKKRKVMWQLVFVNFFIIGIDLALPGVEYASLYTLETTMKGIVYSIKLRLEFAVLNQLIAVTRAPRAASIDLTATRLRGKSSPSLGRKVSSDDSSDKVSGRQMSIFRDPWGRKSSGGERADCIASPAPAMVRNFQEVSNVRTVDDGQPRQRLREEAWVQDFAYR